MEPLSALLDVATSFHTCRDTDALLRTAATRIASHLKARAALLWLLSDDGERLVCRGRWLEVGTRFKTLPASEGLVAEVFENPKARRFSAAQLKPALLVHLSENDRELVKSALYAPIPGPQGVAGVLEILNKTEGEFNAEDQALAEEAARITGRALETRLAVEQEQSSGLETIERLTALYDVSRAFNSVLELTELLPVIADKIRNIMRAEACNIWLVREEDLVFAQQVGEDPTTEEDDQISLGEGLIGSVAQQGEARLVDTPLDEPLLETRRQRAPQFEFTSIICAPLLKDEQVLGVVEVINKLDGTLFDDDDVFFVTNMNEQAAIALSNANLLEAERRVHELDALLAISKEITSTLNIDHVLSTVVHQAATIVPFDRCVIGLFDRSRFILGAVSGESEVPQTREMEELRGLLETIAGGADPVKADHYEGGWQLNESAEPLRIRATAFLEENGYNGFFAIPLRDDQGVVGVLALLSGDAEFLSENHFEILDILASQTTVAIRNARLYQEVPLMKVWQPLAEKRKQLMSVPYARWLEWGWKVGLVVLVLIVVPWKMRIESNATVVPAQRRIVAAQVDGVIKQIPVREAEDVRAGQLLAQLDDSDNRVLLERARTDLDLARRQLAEAEARRDLGAAQQARLRVEMHQAEVALYQEKVEQAQLRSPIDGLIVTSKVEEKVGQRLEAGDTFCEVVEQERMALEMNVPETQISFVRPGSPVAIKLNTFPTDTLRGTVERVSAQTVTAENEQFFVVRAVFPNPGGRVRTGMVGRAKITAAGGWFQSGWYPVGYVMLRAPASWIWRTFWGWLP